MEVFGRNEGTTDRGSFYDLRPEAFAQQSQRHQIALAVIQRKSARVADRYFVYARQVSGATKNLAQQDRFLRGGVIDVRRGVVRSRQPALNDHHAARIETGPHVE